MNEEWVFRLTLVAALVGVLVLRKWYERRAGQIERTSPSASADSQSTAFRLAVLGGVVLLTLSLLSGLLWCVHPVAMAWSGVGLPIALRWVGLAVTAAGVTLLAWSHRVLNQNFFGGAKLRSQHQLVTSGPYRWVRHPMYTAFLMLGIGYGLLSDNWFVGAAWLLPIVVMLIERLNKEESMLVLQFGDAYREYQQRTGRLIPKPGARQK